MPRAISRANAERAVKTSVAGQARIRFRQAFAPKSAEGFSGASFNSQIVLPSRLMETADGYTVVSRKAMQPRTTGSAASCPAIETSGAI